MNRITALLLFWACGTLGSPFSTSWGRLGTYSWGRSYWTDDNPEFMDFFTHPVSGEWLKGDLMINVSDYSSADNIPQGKKLIKFLKQYRQRSGNYENVLYLTYGDVTQKDEAAMMTFVSTFFNWVRTIKPKDAKTIGRIGISFDVEMISAGHVELVLLECQHQRETLIGQFAPGQILIQHTIDDEECIKVTNAVMKYADSALAMTYGNYLASSKSPDDPEFRPEWSFEGRVRWLLTTQCPKCLNGSHALKHYKAKITLMVEAGCQMGVSGKRKTFCVNDADGANFMASVILPGLDSIRNDVDFITPEQYNHLFNHETTFAVHNFEWFRCFPPFDSVIHFPSCERFHELAAQRREL